MGKNVRRKRPDFENMVEETITTPKIEYTDTTTPTDTDSDAPVVVESESTPTVTQEQEFTPAPTKQQKKKQSTRTRTHTPKYAPAHLPTMGSGERKTERLQLVVRPSTKSRLAAYARDYGTSSNEVVQRLLDELLDEAGY